MPQASAGEDLLRIIDDVKQRAQNPRVALNAIVDRVIFPALERNWRQSGIKTHSGMLYSGVTRMGAKGNYVIIVPSQNVLKVGVSNDTIPYANAVLQGRGPVTVRKAKFLRFVIDGKVFFRKRAQRAKPRPVHYLTGADITKATEIAQEYVTSGK